MFYVVKSLSLNPGLESMAGGNFVRTIMGLGSGVVSVFSFIFLFYTNSFLVKRRKKEFGVFNVLGMEKRHLSGVVGWETAPYFSPTHAVQTAPPPEDSVGSHTSSRYL